MSAHDAWPPGKEPSVDELLSDPIAGALLRSDGLTRRSVEAWVNQVSAERAAKLALTHAEG